MESTVAVAGVECADTTQLVAQLDELHRLVHATPDTSLAAVVAAADEVASDLVRREGHAHRCEDELRRAQEATAAARRRLESLLQLVRQFASEAAGQLEVGSPESRSTRRRWFGRERRRGLEMVGGIAGVDAQVTPAPTEEPAWTLRDDDRCRQQPSASGEPIGPELVEGYRIEMDEDRRSAAIDPSADADVVVHLLGPFRLKLAGQLVDTSNGGKAFRVLRYLLSHRERPVPKDTLIDLFWPDSDIEGVGRSLHQAIYTLRKTLRNGADEARHIVFENGAYLINPELSLWCDLDVFESSAAAGRIAELEGRSGDAVTALSCAERCYGGDYLADSPYEEWTIGERERLRLQYVDVANRLADLLLESDNIDESVVVSQKLLRQEPCDDATHRRLIRCYGLIGQRNLVIRQYRAYVACAERLYGLGPSPETTALYRSLIENE